jgi:hypothetical protein
MSAVPPPLPPEVPDTDPTKPQLPVHDTRDLPAVPAPIPPLPEKPKRDHQIVSTNTSIEKSKQGHEAYLYPQRPEPIPRRNNPLHVPVWSVLLMLTMVAGCVGLTVLAVVALGGRVPPAAAPRFVILTAGATLVPQITIPPLATPTLPALQPQIASGMMLTGPTLVPVPTNTPSPTPAPEITIGAFVLVIGDRGMNVRSGPGTESTVVRVVDPGSEFIIVDGPQEANGLRWWLIASRDGSFSGWAADNDGTTDLLEVIVVPSAPTT